MKRNQVRFESSEVAWSAGYGLVPEAGYRWRYDFRPVSTDGLFLKGNFDFMCPSDYEGPWLVPNSGLLRRYPVLKNRQVLHDFVRLSKDVGEVHVSKFADEWGWLGDTFVVEDTALIAEPLASWKNESETLACLWATWEAVRDLSNPGISSNDRIRADWYLEERIEWSSSYDVRFRWPGSDRRWKSIANQDEGHDARWKRGETLEPARYFVHKEINRCLKGHVDMAVLPYLGSRVRFFPDSLRTALYMHFAFEISGIVGEQKTCGNPKCRNGGTFLPRRRDQRYCNKDCRELAGYYRRKK